MSGSHRVKGEPSCVRCQAEGLPLRRAAKYDTPEGSVCTTHWRSRSGGLTPKTRGKKSRGNDLTGEQYRDLLAFQGGRCPICLVATGRSKALAVDHDHKTGERRGILCSTDNRMLGRAKDDPAFFRRAADYLENPPARRLWAPNWQKELEELRMREESADGEVLEP